MLTQTETPISGLLDGYEAALTEMGYSITTKLLFIRRADLIIRRHLNSGLEYLVSDIIIGYAQEIDERYFNGDMKRRYHERAKREVERFVNYAFSGNSNMQPSPLRGARQKLLKTLNPVSLPLTQDVGESVFLSVVKRWSDGDRNSLFCF